MAVDAFALTSVDRLRSALCLTSDDLQKPGITIYNSSTDATAAAVEVTATTMVLVVTTGANAGSSTITFANSDSDTFSELETKVEGLSKGWVVEREGPAATASTDLTVVAATGCLLIANKVTLDYLALELLETLIDAASDKIENALGRKIMSREYIETYNGDGRRKLLLNQSPVTLLSNVRIGFRESLDIQNSDSTAVGATVEVTDTALTLTILGGSNAGSDSVAFATYTTMGAVETQIGTLGKGWAASNLRTDHSNEPSDNLRRTPGADAWNHLVAVELWSEPSGGISAYYDAGIVTRSGGFTPGFENVRVKYTAGYASTPDDIEQVATQIASGVYKEASLNPALKSEKLGDYAYERAVAGAVSSLDVMERYPALRPYLRMVS